MASINFDRIQSQLNTKAAGLGGSVSLNELFSPEFIIQHSKHSKIKDILSLANVHDQTSFDSWANSNPDQLISSNTEFESWSQCVQQAGKAYAVRQLQAQRSGRTSSNHLGDEFDSIFITLNFSVK